MIRLIFAALLVATTNSARPDISLAQAPRASFIATCTPGTLVAKFDASASTRGSGGPIKLYKWNWSGGRSESHAYPTASNSWGVAGKVAVKLTVVDSAGQSSNVTQRTITLPCAVPVPPRVDTVTIKLPPDTVLRVDTIRTPKPAPDTVKLPCPCDTTKPPPIVVPPPPDTTPVPPPPPAPTGEQWAELPRVYLDTKLIPPTGKILSVPIGANLQAALNAAQGGDVIELANGGVWSGNFSLPNKAGSSWIVIRPANMGQVPAEGTRMSPAMALAANLPKILSPNNQGAINTDVSSHHWRLVAIEVTQTVTNTGLIRLGSGSEQTLAQMPHDIVLDRMYVHGTATGENRRCVTLNGAAQAVIDSYIADCHQHGSDSQAISGWGGPGPFKITNNYLEAASENIMFGGSDPAIQGLIPSDIEIRRNHFTKNPSWVGQGWVVKNLFEIKNAQRVLFEGNVLENNWRDGQGGSAIVLKSVNQGGGCPWCVAKDITVRLNLIKNVGSGFALTGHDRGAQAIMTRVTITDNLVTNINQAPFSGDGRGILLNNDPIDLTFAHNTVVDPTNMAVNFGGPTTEPPTRLVIRDNVIGGGQYGVKGQGIGTAAALAAFMPNGGFTSNLLIQAAASGYPATTSFSSVAGVGFAVDWSLSATSKFVGKATTGRDLGADVAAIMKAVASVVVP